MIPDLRDLYQQLILDHGKRPRNFRELEKATHHAEGFNPLCGDQVDVYVEVEDGVVKDASFRGAGCAISTASASLMTEALKGKKVDEAMRLFESFQKLVTGTGPRTEGVTAGLGKLAVFSGVCDYPTRVKCAVLVWHTLKSALEKEQQTVSTE